MAQLKKHFFKKCLKIDFERKVQSQKCLICDFCIYLIDHRNTTYPHPHPIYADATKHILLQLTIKLKIEIKMMLLMIGLAGFYLLRVCTLTNFRHTTLR